MPATGRMQTRVICRRAEPQPLSTRISVSEGSVTSGVAGVVDDTLTIVAVFQLGVGDVLVTLVAELGDFSCF